MAYKDGDLGYIECSNCDIFYSADTDDDPCPFCDAKTLLLKIGWVLEQPCWRTYGALATLLNDINDVLGD